MHSFGIISHERRGDERTEANEEGAPTRDEVVAIGNVWKARHVAVRTRLQPIRAMAGKEVGMNVRKQRRKRWKRFVSQTERLRPGFRNALHPHLERNENGEWNDVRKAKK